MIGRNSFSLHDINDGAIISNAAKHLLIGIRICSTQILTHHIEVLVAFRIVFCQIIKLNVIAIFSVILKRESYKLIVTVAHGRRIRKGITFAVTPQMHLSGWARCAAIIQPFFCCLKLSGSGQRQTNGPTIANLCQFIAITRRSTIVVADGKIVTIFWTRNIIQAIIAGIRYHLTIFDSTFFDRIEHAAIVQIVAP